MMSSASWCEKNKSKIFKDNKIARALRAEFTREIKLSLVDNLHEKKHRKRP